MQTEQKIMLKKMDVSTQIVLFLSWISLVVCELSYEECRADDVLFINPMVSLEINDSSSTGSEFKKTIKSPSEFHCFSKCKNTVVCKSATFFDEPLGNSKCLLKDTNRFGVRNRIKISTGKYFEKTDGCSMVARERRRVIGMVENVIDCKDVLNKGWKQDGVYLIQRPGEDTYRPIRCRMSILGGGWTVIQRRIDESLSFEVDWESYKHGFGEISREFWYGNENIHNLTKNGDSEIIFELQSASGVFYYPFYQLFAVGSEEVNYKLTVGPYEHKYGPSLPAYSFTTAREDGSDFLDQNQMEFSTKERDNDQRSDINCSTKYYSGTGWWYNGCALAQFNADKQNAWGSVTWKYEQITGKGSSGQPLKSSEMMLRRKS